MKDTMVLLFGKRIEEYTKEELWEMLGKLSKPKVKSDEEINQEVEVFIKK